MAEVVAKITDCAAGKRNLKKWYSQRIVFKIAAQNFKRIAFQGGFHWAPCSMVISSPHELNIRKGRQPIMEKRPSFSGSLLRHPGKS